VAIEKRVDKLKDGTEVVRWRAVIWLPGHTRRIVCCSTENEARNAEAQLRVDRRVGKLGPTSRKTFGAWLDEWLVDVAAHRVAPTTLRRYKGIIDYHLKPVLGAKRLDRLTALDITKARNRWLAGKNSAKPEERRRALAPRSVRQHLAIIHKALADAVRLDLIPFNPADRVEIPRASRFEPQVLDPEAAARMIAAARGGDFFVPVLLALSTGMRRGEILALRWGDVDLKAGTLMVRRSAWQDDGGERRDKEPKSAAGRRVVPLPAFVVMELKKVSVDLKERRLAHPELGFDSPLVCQQADVGGPPNLGSFSYRFGVFAKANGFAGTRFHDLRHTFATLNMAAGASPAAVGRMLGHSSAAFTMRQYVHAQASELERLAERMDRVLSPQSAPQGDNGHGGAI
jgi:integrase